MLRRERKDQTKSEKSRAALQDCVPRSTLGVSKGMLSTSPATKLGNAVESL